VTPASALALAELTSLLLVGAGGNARLTAAVTLLAKEGTWLVRTDFVDACVSNSVDGSGKPAASIDWAAAVRHSRDDGASEVVTVAAWIAGSVPESPCDEVIGALTAEQLALVLLSLAGVGLA
jgi:hypothetical protein